MMATRAKMKDVVAVVPRARTPSTEAKLLGANPSSFLGMIIKDIGSVTTDLLGKIKQDTGKGANTSRILAELFMWNWIGKFADSKYDKLLAQAKDEGVLGNLEGLEIGVHGLAESKHFFVTVTVTEPVRRFDPDALCKWALAMYNVPTIIMKEQIDKAKTPTKSQIKITIAERA
jgi:hypothetical protein